ncbi:MAG: hypothetical protein JNL13_13465 [Chitinophagaceae bacterium]|nr:hypothetical protein [Chitinophagaceae bacterium]
MTASCRIFFLAILLLCNACVKESFTVPGGIQDTDPAIPEYSTIAALRADMGSSGGKISRDILISGVVIADDRQGNLYKQVIIDDGTAAMPVLLDAYNLYNDFPVGRRLSIRCKDLYTRFYYKLPQLGFAPDDKGNITPIPYHLWDQYLLKGSHGNEVPLTTVLPADIRKAVPELYNRLVHIRGVQFADTSLPRYAQPAELAGATSIWLMDCDSNAIQVRTSGYCSFQSFRPPAGSGTLTAVYTVFNNTPQLVLRDTADVHMRLPRCF